ncbi:MAG: AAA family ATPase [Nocardioides sp.]|uniref:AAA family ATPase n=1 Tax=Nocardioides sp. TaxID=35761 RepID=UPI00238FC78A|nr:AAA family ATPase [Nocardioides sp.]MDE0775925.1 AAA family ATPase [Nocardioides sp.]
MNALAFAERLLAVGIPVVAVGPDDRPRQAGWQDLTAEQCDLSLYRRGDALGMVGGHGIDAVDVDTKDGGAVDNLPPFPNYGVTRTPSGGAHYIVPSSGLGKLTPLTTDQGHVGDYVGGRPDGSGRLLLFLPGSVRSKYPRGGYVEETPWDVEGCLAASPDPGLVEALLGAGGAPSAPRDVYLDDSPDRDPALGPHPYARGAVEAELARLDECDALGWGGPPWDSTTFEVACNLIEFGNSNWSGYDLDDLHDAFLLHAPADEGFHSNHHAAKWASALNRTNGGGRRPPESSAADDFDDLPPLEAGSETPTLDGALGRFPRLSLADLLNPERPAREYVVEPFVAAGTSVALVAPAGHRKSLLLLGMSVAVARGEPEFAGMAIPRARRVFYVDMENTEDDLRDRLLSFGVTPGDDLARLTLISLPSMDPLDTAKGGAELLAALDAYGLEPGDLVALDSYQRVTQAGENDSDTTRGYYRHTGVHLKARGLTVVRTDNTGKDVKRGARGSSGKRDDVDVEYLVESTGAQMEITVGKARQRGVDRLLLTVTTDDGRTSFRTQSGVSPVEECVRAMDQLGLPADVSQRRAEAELAENTTHEFARKTVREAWNRRRGRAVQVGAAFPDDDLI